MKKPIKLDRSYFEIGNLAFVWRMTRHGLDFRPFHPWSALDWMACRRFKK